MNQLDIHSVRTFRDRGRKREGKKTGRRSLVDRHWQRLWMVAADGGGDEKGKKKSGRGMIDRDRAEN